MSLTIGGITFDRVVYDEGGDVLYVHVGEPSAAVDFDETPEGHHVRLDREGRVIGLTLVRPRHLLETEGEVRITLPAASHLHAEDLAPVLG